MKKPQATPPKPKDPKQVVLLGLLALLSACGEANATVDESDIARGEPLVRVNRLADQARSGYVDGVFIDVLINQIDAATHPYFD